MELLNLLPRHHRAPRAAASLLLGLLAVAGCEQPAPPPPPPPPRALTIVPQRKQGQTQQNKDKSECQNTANATANSSESWAHIFAAYMSGRGYGVQ